MNRVDLLDCIYSKYYCITGLYWTPVVYSTPVSLVDLDDDSDCEPVTRTIIYDYSCE